MLDINKLNLEYDKPFLFLMQFYTPIIIDSSQSIILINGHNWYFELDISKRIYVNNQMYKNIERIIQIYTRRDMNEYFLRGFNNHYKTKYKEIRLTNAAPADIPDTILQ